VVGIAVNIIAREANAVAEDSSSLDCRCRGKGVKVAETVRSILESRKA
jgi:hypothetical protein